MKYTITTVIFVALLSALQAQIEIQPNYPPGGCFCEGPAQRTFIVMAEGLPRKTEPAVREWNEDLDGVKHHSEVDLDGISSDAFYKYFQDGNFTDAEIEGYLKFAGDFDNPIDQKKLKSQPSLAVLWKKNKDGDPDFCSLSLTSGTTPVEIRSSGCDGIDLKSMIKKLPDPDTDAGVAFWSKYEEVFINDHFDADGILDFDATQKVNEFLKDLQKEGDDFLDEFVGDPDLMEAWDVLSDYPIFRKNIDHLNYTEGYLSRTGKTKQQFLDDLEEFEDGEKIFLDELDDTPASGQYVNNPSGVWNENPFLRGRANRRCTWKKPS